MKTGFSIIGVLLISWFGCLRYPTIDLEYTEPPIEVVDRNIEIEINNANIEANELANELSQEVVKLSKLKKDTIYFVDSE